MTPGLRRLCYALLAAGLLIAGISAAHRIQADRAAREVLVLVDWRELNALPETGTPASLTDRRTHELPWELLELLPGALLAYGEETVGDLVQQGILRPARVTTAGPAYEVADQRYIDDIARGAARHGYWYERSPDTGGRLVLQLPLSGENLTTLPLAWRSDVIALARSRNVPVVLRPTGTPFLGPDGLAETIGFASNQPLVVFHGKQVLGYPHQLAPTAELLRRHDLAFGWVEFDDQGGGGALAARMAPDLLTRVHSITAEEMEKYTVARAVDRFELAVTERGIRVLFLRPFQQPGPNQIADTGYAAELAELNRTYFAAVSEMLRDKGFTLTQQAPVIDAEPPAWLTPLRRIAVTLATAAATTLLLWLWVPSLKRRWAIGLLAAGAGAAIAVLALDGLFTLVLLAAGIVFPTLAFWVALTLYQRLAQDAALAAPSRLGAALLGLLAASGISAAGGLLIHGGMWDTRTMLHVEQYRGVTLTLAVPALLLAAYAWQAETLQDAWDAACRCLSSFWQRFMALWTAPIRYGDVAFILLAVGALGIVLLRSGNEGPFGAFGFESALRGWLEGALDVRPRTKELLGHPALVLFLLSIPWRTRLSLLLALAGILAQTSILNTFCHLHTPLEITLKRVALGLILGLLAGAVWGLVLLIAGRFLRLRGSDSTAT